MRKFVAIVLTTTVLCMTSSCASLSSNDNKMNKHFIKEINNFSYDTAQTILNKRSDNFNYSPISLYYALAVTGIGARGETQQQIFHLLNVTSEEKLLAQCKESYNLLYSDNKTSKLKIANSIWLNEGNKFKEPFVTDIEKNFQASTYSVDFSDKETEKAMAEWISEHTNGMLTPRIKNNPKQVMSIINTIYFCDEWINEFNKELTQEGLFHTENGDIKTVFMNQTDTSEFVKVDQYTRSSLPLKGDAQMVFILPDKGVKVSDLISKYSMKEIFEKGKVHSGEVKWKIPKISFDTECKLKDVLNTLGMKNAFKSTADFSSMTDEKVFVSEIIQQTHLSIDEKGVEAAAFTKVDMFFGTVAKPKESIEMNLDRPFIYGIVSDDGTLIFVGVFNNPSAQ